MADDSFLVDSITATRHLRTPGRPSSGGLIATTLPQFQQLPAKIARLLSSKRQR